MNYSLLVIVLLSHLTGLANGSECGESTIPYSLEVLPSGQPILGCARPTCFGWHPSGHQLPTAANFFRIDQQLDGFLRDDPFAIHTFNSADPRIYSQQQATCEHEFQSLSCNSEDQWVGGISPVMNATTTQVIAYQCCTYAPLRASTDRGVATVSGGQIVVGGEVTENNQQYAFDYISNIEKKLDEVGEVFYEVNIRRFSCLDLQKADRSRPEILNSINIIRHMNEQKAVAHQVPNVEVDANQIESGELVVPEGTIESGELVVPEGVVNGQEVIIEEIVAQQGFIQETTSVSPPPPPAPDQPQELQPVVHQPVAYPAQPSGYYPPIGFAPPAGLQACYCLPADSTVKVFNKGITRMDELEIGDWVQALSGDGEEVTYVPVQYWLHRDPNQVAEFIEFYLDNGRTFSLTEKHMIYVTECSPSEREITDVNSNPVAAENVKAGDCFFVARRQGNKMYQRVKVLSIRIVQKTGIYAPMTSFGNLLVDRIHTSCLSETDNYSLQNTFFAAVLNWKNTIISFFLSMDTLKENNLGYGLNVILEVIDLLIPENLM